MSVKVTHVLKDDTVLDSLENKVIKVEGNEELYGKLEKLLEARVFDSRMLRNDKVELSKT